MRLLILFALLAVTVPALGCINDHDSDSLAKQAKPLPDLLDIIVGRFPRNPPLYYQMRIERELPEVTKNPRLYGDYDDVAAAYDKLGNPAEALSWMARKKAALPPYDWRNPAVKDAWYRYYANDGTFRVHDWLHSGAKKSSLAEMEVACSEIQRGLQINPHAHFGREKYQLMAMRWIINGIRHPESYDTLSAYVMAHDDADYSENSPAVKGLSGLIVLGGAWESPDIFDALRNELFAPDTVTLSYMAGLRFQELLKEGRHSVVPSIDLATNSGMEAEGTDAEWTINKENLPTLDQLYSQLRAAANDWQAHRTAFMMAKLKSGDHPDIDPHFWEGYVETPRPNIDVDWYDSRQAQSAYEDQQHRYQVAAVCGLAIAFIGFCYLGLRWSRQ